MSDMRVGLGKGTLLRETHLDVGHFDCETDVWVLSPFMRYAYKQLRAC